MPVRAHAHTEAVCYATFKSLKAVRVRKHTRANKVLYSVSVHPRTAHFEAQCRMLLRSKRRRQRLCPCQCAPTHRSSELRDFQCVFESTPAHTKSPTPLVHTRAPRTLKHSVECYFVVRDDGIGYASARPHTLEQCVKRLSSNWRQCVFESTPAHTKSPTP